MINFGFILVNVFNDKNNVFFVIFFCICFEVVGLWFVWGVWGKCFVMCGRGIYECYRMCLNLFLSYGGVDCVGFIIFI